VSDVTPLAFQDSLLGAFKTYFEALYPTIPISYPNKHFDTADAGDDDDATWVRIYILGSNDAGVIRYSNSVARNHFQRNGFVTVEIYTRQGGSLARPYAVANDILRFFENPGVPNALFSNLSAPQETGPDGSWFQLTVRADWLYFTDRSA